jgi:hypothetical protein
MYWLYSRQFNEDGRPFFPLFFLNNLHEDYTKVKACIVTLWFEMSLRSFNEHWTWNNFLRPSLYYTFFFFYSHGLSISLSFSLLAPTLDLKASVKRFVSMKFLNPKIFGRTSWMGDQPSNKHRQTSMPWVGFEPTITAFEPAKTIFKH